MFLPHQEKREWSDGKKMAEPHGVAPGAVGKTGLERFVAERLNTTSGELFLDFEMTNEVRWFKSPGCVECLNPAAHGHLVTGVHNFKEIASEWRRQLDARSATTGPFPDCSEWPEEVDKEVGPPAPERIKAECPWCGGTNLVQDEYGRNAPCSCTMRRDAPQDRLGHDATVALAQAVTWAYKSDHQTLVDGRVVCSKHVLEGYVVQPQTEEDATGNMKRRLSECLNKSASRRTNCGQR